MVADCVSGPRTRGRSNSPRPARSPQGRDLRRAPRRAFGFAVLAFVATLAGCSVSDGRTGAPATWTPSAGGSAGSTAGGAGAGSAGAGGTGGGSLGAGSAGAGGTGAGAGGRDGGASGAPDPDASAEASTGGAA